MTGNVMFRSKKKKINAGSRRVVRTFDDDEDENDVNQVGKDGVGTDDKQRLDIDEPPSALMIALQRRKDEKRNKKKQKGKRKIGSGGPVVMSFDIEEADENDDDDQHRKKKKKRKKGLGFGGGDNFTHADGDARKDDEMGSFTTSAYGKDALEQLKSEQKRQKVQRASLESATTPNEESMNIDPAINDENSPEESFIPLDDSGGGNDTRFENHGRKKEQEKDKIFVVDDPPQEESHGWERQIEQRAGLRPSSQQSRPQTSKLLSLDELSEKLQSTVETIDRQREELENSTNRLRADREHAKSNSKDYQERLKQIGLACEFYQSTRRDLTLWVGALRDLHEKVQPIATAFTEMLQVQTNEFGQEFRSWQDDCVATLYQNRRLDRVLGRQPESTLLSTASNETVIDEFGRDIGSQYQRDRELRFKKRLEYISSNDGIIKREDHDEGERSKILQEALKAALEDLDQEYTSITHLKSIFDGWFTAHFDDYQQCFATLSFGDLYAVLVQVELCKSNFFPDIFSTANDGSSATESSILELDRCFLDSPKEEGKEGKNAKKVAKENEGRLARAVEKGVLPILLKILSDMEDKDNDSPFYVFFSATKSSLVSRLVKDIAIDRSSNSSLSSDLQNMISTAISRALEDVSIPLLNKDESPLQSSAEALDSSVKFARIYLVRILQQALCNIITYWFPLIDLDTNSDSETGIHYVLNFINDKYLVLLSSMDVDQTNSESPSAKDLFKLIWEALRMDSRNIIESPSLMLLTMPLRAAALAYQLD